MFRECKKKKKYDKNEKMIESKSATSLKTCCERTVINKMEKHSDF